MTDTGRIRLLPPTDDPVQQLTRREREVLRLIAAGWSNFAICSELCVAPKTLERHIANIYLKLELGPLDDGCHRRVAATLLWLRSPARVESAPRAREMALSR